MIDSRPTSRVAPWLLLAPFLVLFAVFFVYPIAQSLVLSTEQSFGPAYTKFVGLANYADLLRDPLFYKAVGNTVMYSVGAVTIQTSLAMGLALLLNRPGLRGRNFLRAAFFAPVMVGVVFVAVIFSVMFEKRTGLINQTLHSMVGWDLEFPWLQKYVITSLIIATLWQYVGFNMVYFLGALQNVRKDLIEAAVIDGAGPWRRFVHVIVPQIKPVATFVVLLSIVGSFQVFELPYVLLAGPGPDDRGLTIVMYLYIKGFNQGDLGYASAVGWLLATLLMIFALVQRRLGADETARPMAKGALR